MGRGSDLRLAEKGSTFPCMKDLHWDPVDHLMRHLWKIKEERNGKGRDSFSLLMFVVVDI